MRAIKYGQRVHMKVFLVEDDERIRELLTSLVQRETGLAVAGWEDNAPQAIETILGTHPDVVLLDLMLKDSSGIDVLKAVRDAMPSMAIFVVSNLVTPGVRASCMSKGADVVFDKSLELDALAMALRVRAVDGTVKARAGETQTAPRLQMQDTCADGSNERAAATTAATAARIGRRPTKALNRTDAAMAALLRSLPGAAELALYRQRIAPVATASQEPPKFELLLRVRDVHGAVHSPQALLLAAKGLQLLDTLERAVITMACKQIQAEAAHVTAPRANYAINLSGSSVVDPLITDFLLQQLEQAAIHPRQICVEVTETVAISNLKTAAQNLQRLRDAGCTVAVDDFGRGASSFGYLKHLPADIVKIDGSFVKRIEHDRVDRVFVDTMHRMAVALGMRSVAEFVETAAGFAVLGELGVDYAQGYWLHRPELFGSWTEVGVIGEFCAAAMVP